MPPFRLTGYPFSLAVFVGTAVFVTLLKKRQQHQQVKSTGSSTFSSEEKNATPSSSSAEPTLSHRTTNGIPENDEIEDLVETYRKGMEISLSPAQRSFQAAPRASLSPPSIQRQEDAADRAFQERLGTEYQQQEQKSAALQERVNRMQQEQRNEEAQKRASSLMRPLTEEERAIVCDALKSIGPEDEILEQTGSDSIQRGSMQRLRPGQWLNDEVIHYFYVMLANRDAHLCQQDPTRKRSHFFKSFFMTKLLNEGHADPAMDGVYEYRNVKRWSKKLPGKDIFGLDKIFFPVNIGRMHWVCAVAFMQKRRIQFYDSMGDDGKDYLEHIFRYIQDEHLDKKKAPLPDMDQWELITCTSDTPRQLNGFDCGVFTCMFADFLSKDCPLVFGQTHVTQCRERIALSIMNGEAIL